MKNVVFLGAKKIGYECLKILNSCSKEVDYKIVGVLTNNRGENIKQYCVKEGIPLLNSLSEYLELNTVDIAISIQYHEILKKEHIDKVNDIIVNLHMAPLPEYRGCNQFSFAIIEGAQKFGTTIHQLEEGIDSGGIIAEKRFKIEKDIWVKDLYDKTFELSVKLFKETLPSLINGKYSVTPQKEFLKFRSTSLHYRKEINDLKQIDLSWEKEKIERHIRATYMPGFSPPFFYIGDKRIKIEIDENTNA
jgi:methionyl-tRNA formyltransferase